MMSIFFCHDKITFSSGLSSKSIRSSHPRRYIKCNCSFVQRAFHMHEELVASSVELNGYGTDKSQRKTTISYTRTCVQRYEILNSDLFYRSMHIRSLYKIILGKILNNISSWRCSLLLKHSFSSKCTLWYVLQYQPPRYPIFWKKKKREVTNVPRDYVISFLPFYSKRRTAVS